MRKFLISLAFVLNLSIIFAHSPNEAHFLITENKSQILVSAEFPWTISKAVFLFDSSLNENPTKQKINQALFRYVKENFIITNPLGDTLTLFQVIDVKNESHHENYKFVFEKSTIFSIKNSLLFNVSEKQKNIHRTRVSDTEKEFVLTQDEPIIKFKKKPQFNYLFVLLILVPVFLFIYRKKRNYAN